MTALPQPLPQRDSIGALRADLRARIAAGGRFAGLFGSAAADDTVTVTALVTQPGEVAAVDCQVADAYPSLTPDLPAAFWYERELHDLFGVVPLGHPRLEPLVLPLPPGSDLPRPGADTTPAALEPDETSYPPHVSGRGMFTIPHGPVRSGVFESVEYLVETPGEEIPHVRVRAAGKHRGVEKRFEGMSLGQGCLLAERVEGIASVAHALAYAHAVEQLSGVTVPPAAELLRVVHAELERIANHLDVAVKLADAAGLAVAVARFGWHKERVLRLVGGLCGSRFGRGVICPGGVREWPHRPLAEVTAELKGLHAAIRRDERLVMATPSFLDRLRGTGPLPVELAARHGALGPIGRASGVDDDARTRRPYDGYGQLAAPVVPVEDAGDALARLRVRWVELAQAFILVARALDGLSRIEGPPHRGLRVRPALSTPIRPADGRAIGWAEAPQGEVIYAVEVVGGRIVRCKPRSASFHNLVLFHAVFAGDILTDFPFIEASFGLSIAGVVL